MKKLLSIIVAMLMITATISTSFGFGEVNSLSEDIIILYTSDVHGNVESGISYAGVAAYKKEMMKNYFYVELVDAGDALNGSALTAVSDGEYAIKAMNAAGYTMFVPGVYDFTYGVSQLAGSLRNTANFDFLSCNFTPVNGSAIFSPYRIVKYGKTKIAYIGINDPETIEKSTAFSKNYNGTYSYSFSAGSKGTLLYSAVQSAIDAAKSEGADYIIAIGNLSEDKTNVYSAQKVISNTKGINAFINGGTHQETSFLKVVDQGGNSALLTNPGSGLENLGVLTVSPGKLISSSLVTSYGSRDIVVKNTIDSLTDNYSPLLKSEIGNTEVKLSVSDPSGSRVVESSETNFGDLVSDAFKTVTGADIGFAQASDIKGNIASGGITYKEVYTAITNDELAVYEVSGMDVMDALEMSVRKYPERTADFLQVSGVTFDIQETVISKVKTNTKGSFTGVDGEYRVSNIKVNGKALDLLGTYTVTGTGTFLKGDTGYSMFSEGKKLRDNMLSGASAVAKYISGNLSGKVGNKYALPQLRMDIIKLVRQSEIDSIATDKAKEMLSNQDGQMAELLSQIEMRDNVIKLQNCTIKMSSTKGTTTKGKPSIKLTWTPSGDVKGMQYQLYKSTKKTSGFKRIVTTSKTTITNTSNLEKGNTYYYKVRGFLVMDGKYYYTDWSNKSYRTIK